MGGKISSSHWPLLFGRGGNSIAMWEGKKALERVVCSGGGEKAEIERGTV